jgi:hypothetical protein
VTVVGPYDFTLPAVSSARMPALTAAAAFALGLGGAANGLGPPPHGPGPPAIGG